MAVVAGAFGWIVSVQLQVASYHSPSEVIGGALLAFAVVTGVAGLLAWFRPVEHQALRYESVSLVVLGVVGILAAGTTAVALAHGFGRLPIALLPRNHAVASGPQRVCRRSEPERDGRHRVDGNPASAPPRDPVRRAGPVRGDCASSNLSTSATPTQPQRVPRTAAAEKDRQASRRLQQSPGYCRGDSYLRCQQTRTRTGSGPFPIEKCQEAPKATRIHGSVTSFEPGCTGSVLRQTTKFKNASTTSVARSIRWLQAVKADLFDSQSQLAAHSCQASVRSWRPL